MTYEEALEFIHLADWKGSKLGLERIRELMRRLGDPQKDLKFIHVAGTNGKGSFCVMLASILGAAGYRTGLYTSPHLIRYNERFKINGEDVSDENFAEAAAIVKKEADRMEDCPTEFERCTAIGLVYFAMKRCEIVVFEVGLGGRLDSTNVIDAPVLAVITKLGLEHTDVLGDTIEEIAFEKAGIIKEGAAVVLYGQDEEAMAPIKARAEEVGANLAISDLSKQHFISESLSGQVFDYRGRSSVELALLGAYQDANCALVLDAADMLIQQGWKISEEAIREGLRTVRWPARFDIISRDPLVILDGAHNPSGVTELASCIERFFPGKKIHFIMGVMADKDYRKMIDVIAPYAESFAAAAPKYSRSLPADKLASELRARSGLAVRIARSAAEGLQLAIELSSEDHPSVIFGSLYLAGEIMNEMRMLGFT